ncbi:hypothetical protein QTI51_32025 [Variovorax sp. J22G73]|nr:MULTISPECIES: hypothetical protein [unclassified Variovorax]MDM0009437.1 hypothetical protein [Variovorax sp. J22R203]MDM0101944.1 hypothetical protein [Variovorax sp. J22G73]
MKKSIFLQHVAFEDLGLFEPILANVDHEINFRQGGATPPARP